MCQTRSLSGPSEINPGLRIEFFRKSSWFQEWNLYQKMKKKRFANEPLYPLGSKSKSKRPRNWSGTILGILLKSNKRFSFFYGSLIFFMCNKIFLISCGFVKEEILAELLWNLWKPGGIFKSKLTAAKRFDQFATMSRDIFEEILDHRIFLKLLLLLYYRSCQLEADSSLSLSGRTSG